MRRLVIGRRDASLTIEVALPRDDLSQQWIAIGAQLEQWATPEVTIEDLCAVEDALAEVIYLRSQIRRLTG